MKKKPANATKPVWVVKIGSGLLTAENGQLDAGSVRRLVGEVVAVRDRVDVVLVSSAAIASGMRVLRRKRRPTTMEELQACSAIGQPKLIATYEEALAAHGLHVAQILLTYFDLDSRSLRVNAKRTLQRLLALGKVVPVINENDTVSYEEIKFGDNDQLSAHVAALIGAERLVILSNVPGLTRHNGRGRVIRRVRRIDAQIEALAGGTESQRSVGGMVSKLKAARIAATAGVPTQIAHGARPGILDAICQGRQVGTQFELTPEA
ncbi:MAG: glutamate 5-kinase [Verrucomicrobiota bacterium]